MRILLLFLLAIVLGIGTGLGTAAWRIRSARWDGRPTLAPEPERPGLPGPGQPVPRLAIAATEFNFGAMDSGGEGSHDFVFTNDGPGPLVLKAGSTSCNCTLSSLQKTESVEVPPGESAKVNIRWKSRNAPGPYRQSATVYTNDPSRPELLLVVVGEITVRLRAEPEELVFTRIPAGQSATGEVRLWCGLAEPPLEIRSSTLSGQETAHFFDVEFQPIVGEQLASDPHAQSGVLVRVRVKPGLPQGWFQQTMLLRTNLEFAPRITVPIKGIVQEKKG